MPSDIHREPVTATMGHTCNVAVLAVPWCWVAAMLSLAAPCRYSIVCRANLVHHFGHRLCRDLLSTNLLVKTELLKVALT